MSPLPLSRRNTSSLRPSAMASLIALVIFSHCALTASAEPTEQPAQLAGSTVQSDIHIADVDVLALSDDFKQVLETKIKPIRLTAKRAEALHELLFGLDGYDIRYHDAHTGTAMETLSAGSGNCVSLANLFVAAARHVGLNAQFQVSEILEDWDDRQDANGYYIVAGHVNVLVHLGLRREMTVEFLQSYEGRGSKTRLISDEEALAQYYNNLGMMKLGNGESAFAYAYIQKALETHDRSIIAWSNLGVLEKRLGNYAAAERAYLKALQYDQKSPTVVKNLYVLYMQRNQPEKAEPYAAIVEEYNRKNPYYLNQIARNAIDKADYQDAIKLLKRAIKIKSTEDKFHFALAKAYYYSGDIKRSRKAMKKAENVAEGLAKQEYYQHKLEALAAVANR